MNQLTQSAHCYVIIKIDSNGDISLADLTRYVFRFEAEREMLERINRRYQHILGYYIQEIQTHYSNT